MSATEVTLATIDPVPANTRQKLAGRLFIALRGLIIPLSLVMVWELAVRIEIIESRLLPAPSEIVNLIGYLAVNDNLTEHIGISTVRVLAGFTIGTLLAILLGGITGLSRRWEALLDPMIQGIRAIPSLAWVPLLLLWMGIDEAPKITLIAIGAFFPVYVNLVAGFHNVDRKLVEVGLLYGLSCRELVRRIFIPAALPALFTGLRNGLSLAWMFLVAAELIAASRGLGFLLTDGREIGRPDIVIAAILLFALLGKITDGILKWTEHNLLSWRDTYGSESI
ncbi:MAG: ABC transporter permease [Methylomicrobium sp.]|nr:ABC transporter permease [Methylomicrobium sp.]